MRNEEVYDFVNVVEGFDGLDDYFIVSVVLFLYVEFGQGNINVEVFVELVFVQEFFGV